jgi:hypothetical protein
MDAGEEVDFTYSGNFGAEEQFRIAQVTGDPTDGTLFRVEGNDDNITLVDFGDTTGAHGWKITEPSTNEYRLANYGSATLNLVAAADLLVGGSQIDYDDMAGTADISHGADPADAGDIRLSNGEIIAWEDETEATITHVNDTGWAFNLGIDVQGSGGITLENDETITNSVDGTVDISGAVTATSFTADASADPTVLFQDSDSLGSDKDAAWIKASMETLTDGAEDADLIFQVIQGGVENTEVLRFDESDDRWEIPTGKHFAVGTTQWDDGSDAIDGEQIANDTIDNDSIDWADMTDLTTDGAVVWGNIAEGELADDSVVMDDLNEDGNFTDWTGNWTFATGTFTLSNGATVGGDVQMTDTYSVRNETDTADDYFSIEATDDVGGTPAQVEAIRVTNAGTSDSPLVEISDSGTTAPRAVTYINVAADAIGNEDFSGIVITGRNAGEAIDQGNPVLWDNTDNEWVEADADKNDCGDGDDPCWPAQGIALATGSDGNALDVLVQGFMRHDDWAFTVTSGTSRRLFLSDNAADNSGVSQTAPSTSGDCVQVIGWAVSDDEAYFNFSGHYLEVE